MPTYRQWRLKNTMSWVKWLNMNHYLRLKNIPLNLSETEQDNSYGLDNKQRMEDGTDLIQKYLLKRERNTLIKYTSGHNIITIRTTSIPPQSKEISSSITTQSG